MLRCRTKCQGFKRRNISWRSWVFCVFNQPWSPDIEDVGNRWDPCSEVKLNLCPKSGASNRSFSKKGPSWLSWFCIHQCCLCLKQKSNCSLILSTISALCGSILNPTHRAYASSEQKAINEVFEAVFLSGSHICVCFGGVGSVPNQNQQWPRKNLVCNHFNGLYLHLFFPFTLVHFP